MSKATVFLKDVIEPIVISFNDEWEYVALVEHLQVYRKMWTNGEWVINPEYVICIKKGEL